MSTDASGDIGWGVCCQNEWHQGVWTVDQLSHSINWKELKAYHYALLRLQLLLRGKLVYIRMDNTCSVHYVNAGTGRIATLCELAKSIRLEEARLSI